MPRRMFDLNIEEVLENWDFEHALREIIANALDEQHISGSAPIQISKDSQGVWHVRDFGRGLQIEHFTLNESVEKRAVPRVIGKFGVGLKDALATFHRRGVEVTFHSKYGTFLLREARKHDFDEIVTLHVEYDAAPITIRGTDVELQGVTDEHIARAKSLFLQFSDEEVLETTSYGQILRRQDSTARVYIQGVLASEEPNFLFSYNITSLTDAMKKRLNRERIHVGRTTYGERVKAMLKLATSVEVQQQLIDDVRSRARGAQSDELSWIEISQMALTLLHQQSSVVFFTERELQTNPNILDNAQSDRYEVIVVSDQQKSKLDAQASSGGPQVRTIERYVEEYNDTFEYRFVTPEQLTTAERQIYNNTRHILELVQITGAHFP